MNKGGYRAGSHYSWTIRIKKLGTLWAYNFHTEEALSLLKRVKKAASFHKLGKVF
jgi:hypothetical protein